MSNRYKLQELSVFQSKVGPKYVNKPSSKLGKKVDRDELRLWVEALLVHMGDSIEKFFAIQSAALKVDPKHIVKKLPAFHVEMQDWWLLNFGNFKKKNPMPQPNKVTINKFMNPPVRKSRARA